MRKMATSCISRGFDWTQEGTFSLIEWSGTGMAAQGGGGVAVPSSVQEASGSGASRNGLVACGSNGNRRMAALHDLVDPFQPCDSVIL